LNENLENNSLPIENNSRDVSNNQALTIFRDDVCSAIYLQNSSLDFLNVQFFIQNIFILTLILIVFFKGLLNND